MTPTDHDLAGWKEAAIAWEVCASIHRSYAKGKDALFTTRQADYVRHAEEARAGFTRRDTRIECDECGQKVTPQFLPIHKCDPARVPLTDEQIRSEIKRLRDEQNYDPAAGSFRAGVMYAEVFHGIRREE